MGRARGGVPVGRLLRLPVPEGWMALDNARLSSPASPSALHGPHLATAKGISLGSTLGQLRSAYGDVRFVGVDKWQAANGVVFVVEAAREPEPLSSKVVEIKFGACGDF